MIAAHAYATQGPTEPLKPFSFERRDPRPDDVVIEILYCGICHSDLHSARNEWGGAAYPLVPGHEIVGRVIAVGKKVKRFRVNDVAGVGCFVDSCRHCESCRAGQEQYCKESPVFTYGALERDGKTRTYGGYSSVIVVDQHYVLKIPPKLPLANVAPLLCAGITTYSPLRRFGVRKGQRVGVNGLGGLGHMAVKLAASMGANVTVFSTSASKEKVAKKLGASHFVISSDEKKMEVLQNQFHFILDTVSAEHDPNALLQLLRREGSLVIVGAPPRLKDLQPFSLIMNARTLAGSLIGGLRETQEMLDYCGRKKIMADVEVIPMSYVNQAYERMMKGDVNFRFSIDMKTL